MKGVSYKTAYALHVYVHELPKEGKSVMTESGVDQSSCPWLVVDMQSHLSSKRSLCGVGDSTVSIPAENM
jgi:hypothetical protein